MSNDKPRLRYVEAIPVEAEKDQIIIVLRDPEELCAQPIALPPPAFVMVSLFDGTRDLRDVQVEINRRFQQIIPIEQIEGLVRQLDEFYLLDNERSLIRREEAERDYARLPSRPAAHAGIAYPAEPDELVKTFDEFFECSDGPRTERPSPERTPRGLVTPHIDLRQGGATMAWAFNELRCPEPPECYIIFGVAHHPTQNLYTLTEKDFDSPIGPARVNRDATERLKELYGEKRLRGEYAHKSEHSVEFQTVFLNYIHRGGHDFTIVPLLCSSIEEDLAKENGSPRDRAEIDEFCNALRTVIDELDQRVCIIAGVDLSHVGKKFGHEYGVDDMRAGLVRAADLRMLEHVKERDPEAFFDHFRPDANARNVDAVSAVYTMLHVLGDGEAELLRYDQYRETQTESMVTYASMVLY